MKAMHYSKVRQNLAKVMDKVCDEHEPLVITRRSEKTVVIIALDDFNSIEETGYLLKNPANAKHLRDSIKQFQKGKYKEHELIE